MTEQWRTIAGFSRYEVSDYGNVRRVVPFEDGKRNCDLFKPKAFRPGGYNRMYQRVTLVTDGERRQRDVYVHRLVLEAFGGPAPSSAHQASHIDGNSKNNHARNLTWELPFENSRRKIDHGTSGRGASNAASRISDEDAEFIILCYSMGMPPRYIHKVMRGAISLQSITRIALGHGWKHLDVPPVIRARCRVYSRLNINRNRTRRIMEVLNG